jgi:hypothetical protein
VTGEQTAKPQRVIEAGGKLRNGLFLEAIAVYEDRISFEVFAARPLRAEQLAGLRLSDDRGTYYELSRPENGVIDGRGRIEFKPAPPAGTSLHLSEPGWGLHITHVESEVV